MLMFEGNMDAGDQALMSLAVLFFVLLLHKMLAPVLYYDDVIYCHFFFTFSVECGFFFPAWVLTPMRHRLPTDTCLYTGCAISMEP